MPSTAPGPRANIAPESPRAPTWFNIFGTLEGIPLTKYLPDITDLPGKQNALVYLLDLNRITPIEREKLIEHLAYRFGIDRDIVAASLDREGVPILADDVTVSIPLHLVL